MPYTNIPDSRLEAGKPVLASDMRALRDNVEFLAMPVGSMYLYVGSSDPSSLVVIADGRLLSRTTYAALFAIIGTTYGSTTGSNFRIPDLRGRTAIGSGTGSGLTARTLGTSGGNESNTYSGIGSSVPSSEGGSPYFGGVTVDVMQPYVVLNYVIRID